jgi:hypothetical protein
MSVRTPFGITISTRAKASISGNRSASGLAALLKFSDSRAGRVAATLAVLVLALLAWILELFLLIGVSLPLFDKEGDFAPIAVVVVVVAAAVAAVERAPLCERALIATSQGVGSWILCGLSVWVYASCVHVRGGLLWNW